VPHGGSILESETRNRSAGSRIAVQEVAGDCDVYATGFQIPFATDLKSLIRVRVYVKVDRLIKIANADVRISGREELREKHPRGVYEDIGLRRRAWEAYAARNMFDNETMVGRNWPEV
jgi:hypothetical protein